MNKSVYEIAQAVCVPARRNMTDGQIAQLFVDEIESNREEILKLLWEISELENQLEGVSVAVDWPVRERVEGDGIG